MQTATEAEVLDLSLKLNRSLVKLFPANPAWFKLFKYMDDGGGVICFKHFVKIAREELMIYRNDMPDSLLKSVWKAIDLDSSGKIDSNEFGIFMRLGESYLKANEPGTPWKEKLHTSKKMGISTMEDKVKEEKQVRGISGLDVPPADEATVRKMAAEVRKPCAFPCDNSHFTAQHCPSSLAQLQAKAHELFPLNPAWYRLFKYMDGEGSGNITYREFADMVRNQLKKRPEELSDSVLKGVWAALDEDSSGLVSTGEFGRCGKHQPQHVAKRAS